MSIVLGEFWTRLVKVGIADAQGCKRLAAAYSQANRGTPPSDSVTLAKFLVKTGELTDFQARALLGEPARDIRFGDFVQRAERLPAPLSQWIPVRRCGDRCDGILFRPSANQLSHGRDQWVEAHASVDAQTLQLIQPDALGTPAASVFSPLSGGSCLSEVLDKRGRFGRRQTCEIGIAIADALMALHARSLTHGAVRADRVWLASEGGVTLLRDPSGPPAGPTVDSSHGWLDTTESPAAYAAPEFVNPGQACNQSTDIYSLGCLLFRVVIGRPPFSGSSATAVLAAHTTETPTELADAIGQGELGDPLLRVIAYAMAKNPSARFADLQQLSNALRATLPLLGQEDVVNEPTKAAMDAPTAGLQTADSAARQKTSRNTASKKRRHTAAEESTQEKTRSASPQSKSSTAVASTRASTKDSPRPPEEKAASERHRTSDPQETSEPRKTQAGRPTTPQRQTPEGQPSRPARSAMPKGERRQPAEPAKPPQTSRSPGSEPPVAASSDAADGKPNSSQPVIAQAGLPPLAAAASAVIDRETDGQESDASQQRQVRRRRKKKNNAPLVLGGLCVTVLMLMIGLLVYDPGDPVTKTKQRPKIPDVIPRVSNTIDPTPGTGRSPTGPPPVAAVAGYELVDDDHLLWVPPYGTDQATSPLELLPPGPGIVVSARLAAIRQSALGRELIESLSPELEGLMEAVSARAKVPLDSISRCSAALHPGENGWPRVSLAIELSEPMPLRDLTNRWQMEASRTPEGATIYAGDEVDGDAYFVDTSESEEKISRFAVGSLERMREVAENEGGPIPLPTSLKQLWKSSSVESDLTVLVTPNFLFADVRMLLPAAAPELVDPLKNVLIPDVAGALVSATVDAQTLYLEVRLAPSGGISEPALMRSLSETISGWPKWADGFVEDSVPDRSWRRLASKLPFMMQFVVDNTRFGVSESSVVANAYLPARAAPQITLATLLALNTKEGPQVAVANVASEPKLTVEQMLDRKMSVSFDQESLEFAVNVIVDEFKQSLPSGSTMPSVRIIGGDLQLMGITQNQQIRNFQKTDLPLRTVLTDLVLGANPDKTATGPDDPKQALVWVLADDPEAPSKKVILVTTRQASQGRYELPKEFLPAT